MRRLVWDLIDKGYLRSDLNIGAFSEIDRADFVPSELKDQAEADAPLPIGYGQTISQPLTVAFMLELLELERGQNVLDLGSGSGWTSALLSHIVGSKGKVTAVEIIPELCRRGEKNAEKFGFVSKGIVQFHCVDGSEGFPENAPYDRILVSAMADEIPKKLLRQLKTGGKLVIPVRGSIWRLEKTRKDNFQEEEYPGFSFVPLITKDDK